MYENKKKIFGLSPHSGGDFFEESTKLDYPKTVDSRFVNTRRMVEIFNPFIVCDWSKPFAHEFSN